MVKKKRPNVKAYLVGRNETGPLRFISGNALGQASGLNCFVRSGRLTGHQRTASLAAAGRQSHTNLRGTGAFEFPSIGVNEQADTRNDQRDREKQNWKFPAGRKDDQKDPCKT